MKFVNRLATFAILLAATSFANSSVAQYGGAAGSGPTGGASGAGPTGGAAAGFGTAGTTMGGSGTTGGTSTGGTGFGTSGTSFGTGGTTMGSSTSRTGTTTGTSTGTGTASGTGTAANAPSNRMLSDVGEVTAGGMTGGRGATGGFGGGGFGGFGGAGAGGLSPFGLNPFGTGANSTQSKPAVRTRLRAAIVVPPRSQLATQTSVQQRVTPSISQPRFQGVEMAVADQTHVIRGTVTNESDRRMAQLLLRLEPGVSKIENRITVSP